MSFKRIFQAVETHSGEPMRVVTGGVPNIPGNTVYEQMKWLEKNDDQVRMLMLREPRGYPPVCCNLLVPPKHPEAVAGYIIMEQTEYVVMSGGNTISVATVLLETGMIPMKEPITEFTLEAPAGLIRIKAECQNGKVTQVIFKNVPAFAVYLDKEIDVPHPGKVTVDVAWGGMFYVIADVRQFKELELIPEHGAKITHVTSLILGAAQEQLPVVHPDYPGIGITNVELSGPASNPNADWKNTVRVGSGFVDLNNPATWTAALDRCPCGTGTCAKMAVLSIINAIYLTAVKTGAGAGIATDLMAGKDASRLGIIGTGVQALTQVLAIQEVREIADECVSGSDIAAIYPVPGGTDG